MPSPSLVVILAEDKLHQDFAYRIFRNRGFEPREIRKEPLPAGRGGDAKAFIKKKLPELVNAIRSRPAEGHLIVLVDADQETVLNRAAQLDRTLTDSRVEGLGDRDRAEYWIPKRNIETWLVCLLDEDEGCSEETNYKLQFKHRYGGNHGSAVAKAVEEFLRTNVDAVRPNSLRRIRQFQSLRA